MPMHALDQQYCARASGDSVGDIPLSCKEPGLQNACDGIEKWYRSAGLNNRHRETLSRIFKDPVLASIA